MNQRNHKDWRAPHMMSDVPSSWVMVEHHARLYGGWSKYFARSAKTFDEEVVIAREADNDFWLKYEMALMEQQFRDVVEQAIVDFKSVYPDKKIPKKELRDKLALALLQNGWKPVISRVKKEISRLKRERREELKALRGGMTKTEWNKHLKSQRRLS